MGVLATGVRIGQDLDAQAADQDSFCGDAACESIGNMEDALRCQRSLSWLRAASQLVDEIAWQMDPGVSPTQTYRSDDAGIGMSLDGVDRGGCPRSCHNAAQLGSAPCATVLDSVEVMPTCLQAGTSTRVGAGDVGSPLWACLGADDIHWSQRLHTRQGTRTQRRAILCPECGTQLFDAALTSGMVSDDKHSTCCRFCSCGAAVTLVFSSAFAYTLVTNTSTDARALLTASVCAGIDTHSSFTLLCQMC